jgi:hypothetical protein
MLYSVFIASGKDEGGKMSNTTTWTNVRFFSTFDEATTLRSSLLERDTSGTLQVKVKRCGDGGKLFVVKTRQSQEIINAAASLDETALKKATKKSKKSSNQG